MVVGSIPFVSIVVVLSWLTALMHAADIWYMDMNNEPLQIGRRFILLKVINYIVICENGVMGYNKNKLVNTH